MWVHTRQQQRNQPRGSHIVCMFPFQKVQCSQAVLHQNTLNSTNYVILRVSKLLCISLTCFEIELLYSANSFTVGRPYHVNVVPQRLFHLGQYVVYSFSYGRKYVPVSRNRQPDHESSNKLLETGRETNEIILTKETINNILTKETINNIRKKS